MKRGDTPRSGKPRVAARVERELHDAIEALRAAHETADGKPGKQSEVVRAMLLDALPLTEPALRDRALALRRPGESTGDLWRRIVAAGLDALAPAPPRG